MLATLPCCKRSAEEELALGRFTKATVEQNGRKVFSGSIDDRAWHAWLTIGVRMVVRP